jgi:hypothetical protein
MSIEPSVTTRLLRLPGAMMELAGYLVRSRPTLRVPRVDQG